MFLGSWKGLVSRPEFGSHTSSKICPVHSFQRASIKSFLPPAEIQLLRILTISVLCALSYCGSQSAHQQWTRASGCWHLFGTLKLMTDLEASGWRVGHVRVLDRGAGPALASVGSSEAAGVQSPLRPVCTVRDFFPGKLTLAWSLLLIEISQNFLRASKGGSKMRL